GWGEDWQIGGKARIPASFPDGTSSSIIFFERYAICGDPNTAWSEDSCGRVKYREVVWNEDGQNGGAVAQHYCNSNNCFPWEVPGWWASYHCNCSGGPCFTDPNNPPSKPGLPYPLYYPFQFVTLPQSAPAARTSPDIGGCDPMRLQSLSPGGGIQVLFCDGHVKGINTNISVLTFAQLIVPNDGQVISEDY